MKILVPNTIELDLGVAPGLAPGTSSDTVLVYDASAPFSSEARDAELLVLWQNSRENLADAVSQLPNLRLVQTLTAGHDVLVAAGFAPSVALSSGRSLHDGPVAEHALALILAGVRRLDVLFAAQARNEWNTTVNDAQLDPATRGQLTLSGANVTIWGFGSIAARLAPMLRMLGATVTGVATTSGTRHGFDVVAADDAGKTLAATDVLVSLLPSSPETARTFDAALFSRLKPAALFVNVGRGATVDEPALADALAAGTLRAAAIDVTDVEPLPATALLWAAPNLILTPHIAGNRPEGAGALVRANIEALRVGGDLVNEVIRPVPNVSA